jgi:hypothetical protein
MSESSSDNYNIYRDDTLTREQHLLRLPVHDWMVCKSWHCFHGNKLNWDHEKLVKYEQSQTWYMKLARFFGIAY